MYMIVQTGLVFYALLYAVTECDMVRVGLFGLLMGLTLRKLIMGPSRYW